MSITQEAPGARLHAKPPAGEAAGKHQAAGIRRAATGDGVGGIR